MSDIVERLESHARNADYSSSSYICFEAAAEIKKLRAEIAAIRQLAGCVEIPLKSFADIKKETKHGSST